MKMWFRWAVTGTPLSTGVADIYGLLAFLKCEPFSERFWWLKICEKPIEMHNSSGLAPFTQCLNCAATLAEPIGNSWLSAMFTSWTSAFSQNSFLSS